MIAVVNFSDKTFRKQQWWNTKSALLRGGVDKVFNYSPDDISKNHLKENEKLFEFSKGYGNYFWKPYIIKKALNQLQENDILIYADSGTVFFKNIKKVIAYLEKKEQSVICFKLPLIEKQWTKRDTFILMDCDAAEYTETRQVTGNFIVLKKNSESEQFVDEYLKFSSDYRVISDAPNTMGKDNYPEFIAHRHDQSILSLLCKKNKILMLDDLSDYGVFPYKYLHRDSFIFDKTAMNTSGNIFKGTILANRKVHPVIYASKYIVRLMLLKAGIKT